ncbi:MAG: tetratricopeptide repeat protein [bacterium]
MRMSCTIGRRRLTLLVCVLASILAFCRPGAAQDPAALIKTGKAALEDGFYELAEKSFRDCRLTATNGAPEADQALILLACAMHGQRRYQDMLSLLSPLSSPAACYWRAVAYFDLQQYEKVTAALADFDTAYSSNQYSTHALRLLADCHLQTGRTNEALKVFSRLENTPGDSPAKESNLLDWARTLVDAGQTARAKEVLERLINRSPQTSEGRQGQLLLGRLLASGGEFKEAEAVLLPLVDRLPPDPASAVDALIVLAGVYEAQKKPEDATNALSTAVALAPDQRLKRRAELAFGRALLRSKNAEEGAAVLKPYIAAIPPDAAAPSLQLEVAAAFMDAGNAVRAEEAYQHYLEAFSDKAGRALAFSGKGWSLVLRQKPAYEEAADAFLQAFLLFSDPADKVRCLTKVADCRFSNKQFSLAAQAYDQLIAEFPAAPLAAQAMFQNAECAARMNKPDDAVRLFRSVIATNPAGVFADQALMRIAEIKEDQGEQAAALGAYDQLMATYTNSTLYANALLAHGLINFRSLLFETALGDFEKLVLLFPQTEAAEHAAYMRGRCLQILGQEDKAIATWREFLHAYPASQKWTPHVLYRLGEYAFNRGEYGEAEKQFDGIAGVYTNDALAPAALLAAGQAAAKLAEYLDAINYFSSLVTKYPTWHGIARARYEQGDATKELGEYAKAILLFEEIINKYSSSDSVDLAWCGKAYCEFALGAGDTNRYEAAIRSYKHVADSPLAPPDLKLHAQFKIGDCLQKLQRHDEAVEQMYSNVMIPYLDDPKGLFREYPACEEWFTRAAYAIVERMEVQKKWREAIRILKRVVDAGVPASDDAQKRIDKIRLQLWILP